jgi:putative ABC transport system permease protein
MNFWLWLRFALRDLRSGLQGFWVFLSSLTLGTAAIAIIGSLSAAVERGLDEQGQSLLGGDVEFSLIHRQTTPEEMTFVSSKGEVSIAATMRGMAKAGDRTTLVEIKSADQAYPLYGALELEGGGTLAAALDNKGVAVDPLLLGRLGIKAGDALSIGTETFTIRGVIAREPDRLSDGIVLGPRVLMREADLQATGLIQPGSLITWRYRVKLANAANAGAANAVIDEAKEKFPDAGWRLRNRNNAASGAERFVERLGMFMTLVGLSALIVGGAGISNAVSAFVNRRSESIATLKCLGASSRDVFGIYLTEIILLSLLAIAVGLAAGAVAPLAAGALFGSILPLPITARVEFVPLAIAGTLGFLVALAFTLWPLSRTQQVPASALFRHRSINMGGWPGWKTLIVMVLLLAVTAGIVFLVFDDQRIISWFLGGLLASFVVLLGLAKLIVVVSAMLPRPSNVILRHALSNIHRPGTHAVSVILALGLGLTLFVTLALTDQTMSRELRSGIPEKAPAFFFLDVRNPELPAFKEALLKQDGVTEVNSSPMMRGRMVKIKGVDVAKVTASPDSRWATQGDRGLTYADTLPEGSQLVAGEWWPANYDGPPLVSLVDEIAEGLDLKIGDEISVNVLGREISAKVANLRQVNWRSLGINFVMVFSPNTLKSAPHSHIVTVEMIGGDEAKLLNEMSGSFPSVTAIRVKDAISIVSDLLTKMLNGIRGANVVTLLIGVLVLAGALAAGLSDRSYDAVVLKTYGATRWQLMGAFSAEYAGLGLAAAAFGILVGSLSSWFLSYFILELPWFFSAWTAGLTALAAMVLTVAAGLLVTWSALTTRPASVLRNE